MHARLFGAFWWSRGNAGEGRCFGVGARGPGAKEVGKDTKRTRLNEFFDNFKIVTLCCGLLF